MTTVIAGNCGISAAPVALHGEPPDPMNLLGPVSAFRYPTFAKYVAAVEEARPAVNVAALAGHTALRNNHMGRLDRAASSAPAAELLALAGLLTETGAIYTTHLRTEFDAILDALEEAFHVGRQARVPVIVSHLKCAGVQNWGRSGEVLASLERAGSHQRVGYDCYPYAASSSTLDLKQVTDQIDIMITWSTPCSQMGGKLLAEIAGLWSVDQIEAARRLQPAGAVYHGMSSDDVSRILSHPECAVGSDGLPSDPRPHPRLRGTFPRVLGHYSREQKLFSLAEAVRKVTGLSARRFGLAERGEVRWGFWADLVLFDPQTVRDAATFEDPIQPAEGIEAVWVNGVLAYRGSEKAATGDRAGHFLRRGQPWAQSG